LTQRTSIDSIRVDRPSPKCSVVECWPISVSPVTTRPTCICSPVRTTTEAPPLAAVEGADRPRLLHGPVDMRSHRALDPARVQGPLPPRSCRLIDASARLELPEAGASGVGAGRRGHRSAEASNVATAKKYAAWVGAHIVFVDESGFLLIPTVRRTWAPRGKTPAFTKENGFGKSASGSRGCISNSFRPTSRSSTPTKPSGRLGNGRLDDIPAMDRRLQRTLRDIKGSQRHPRRCIHQSELPSFLR
jgi:hypothetical protein